MAVRSGTPPGRANACGRTVNATGALTYTPVANQNGTAVITVTDDGLDGNLSSSGDNDGLQRTLSVTVKAVNDPPVLAATGAKSMPELATLTFTSNASDGEAPGNVLTYSASGLPAGASFDPVTRSFASAPTEGQGPGRYELTFVVSDGTNSSRQPGFPPVIGSRPGIAELAGIGENSVS